MFPITVCSACTKNTHFNTAASSAAHLAQLISLLSYLP
jgi:hypothetical protein